MPFSGDDVAGSTRLRKSADDKVLFGVAGGLAEHFAIDSVLVRLAFILLTLAGGIGLLAYVALALLMPRAQAQGSAPAQVVRENLEQMPGEVAQAARRVEETIRGSPAPGAEAAEPSGPARRARGRSVFGLLLIVAGILLLLANFGLFAWWDWGTWWPVVLILIGLAILARRMRAA